jgi:hypothetical protein
MSEFDVVVRMGGHEIRMDYPKVLDANLQPLFTDKNDLFRMVGEALEEVIFEVKKLNMKTITLSEFQNLPERTEEIGGLCLLNANRQRRVCGVGDVVFVLEFMGSDHACVVQRLIVEEEGVEQ